MSIIGPGGEKYLSKAEICDMFDHRSNSTFYRNWWEFLETHSKPMTLGNKKYYSSKSVQALQEILITAEAAEDREITRQIMSLVSRGISPKSQGLEMPKKKKRWKPNLGDQK